MGYKGIRIDSRFKVGDCVKTKSGLKGKIIGSAEYFWGWEHRIKILGKSKTLYRKESELSRC